MSSSSIWIRPGKKIRCGDFFPRALRPNNQRYKRLLLTPDYPWGVRSWSVRGLFGVRSGVCGAPFGVCSGFVQVPFGVRSGPRGSSFLGVAFYPSDNLFLKFPSIACLRS